MPSLIDIRRRIRSVKNTQQITKAMKMVSAAKLRRAQERVIAARPYSQVLQRMLSNIAQAASEGAESEAHPLLAKRPEERVLLVLMTADGGLAGAFNSNIIKNAIRFVSELGPERVEYELVGRKGRDSFRKRGVKIAGEYAGLFMKPVRVEDAISIARKITERFANAEIDAVYVMGNRFKSVAAPEMATRRILPLEVPQDKTSIDYIYEQDPGELLKALLPRYVENQIYQAMIESYAAYQGARMTAMDAASSNAADMLDRLTLNMNRVRQASITREIIEIVSGAAALD
ncbi:MAG TPA: ATP synthase F1 subunit gamma [Bryobacteraceae bacterium]|jgi:F-type H+-transporting ATPase subunit gamma|nr:ATP synthase F1 subunit gamma [Bryobacteraceae bacterium]